MRSTLFVFLFSVLASSVVAQKPHPILRSFSAVKQPNGVNLKWVIIGGRQCDGTRVFRADETLQFDLVEHIEGICGSQADDVTYSYFDNSPKSNSYNYYRLEMGLQGFTDTVKRSTPGAKDLRKADFVRDVPLLWEKISRAQPKVAWFHGKVAYKNYLSVLKQDARNVEWGLQPVKIASSKVFVTPNPSPANAAFSLDDLTDWYQQLHRCLSDV